MTVAALYVDPNGVYAGLPDVEVWDEARDARLYRGPWPVVAHPPCARWSLMGLCRGYYDGRDEGCFEAALKAVHTFGGVLEHPAHSLAWKRYGLPKPVEAGWRGCLTAPGFSCSVDQRWYGHEANKPTWLYAYGCEPAEMIWGRALRGRHTVRNMHRDPYRGADRSSARSRTPEHFRDVLLAMARSAALAEAGLKSVEGGEGWFGAPR